MAVRWGVTPYVNWRLDRITDTEKRSELMQALLDSSLRWEPMGVIFQSTTPYTRSATAERLIKMGASPNAIMRGWTNESLWQVFLYDLRRLSQGSGPVSAVRESFAEAFQMLLEYNADPFVKLRDINSDP